MSDAPFSSALSVEDLDHLQRDYALPAPAVTAGWTSPPPAYRRLARIHGVGRVEKRMPRERSPGEHGELARLPSQDLLTGLYGHKIPIAFALGRRAGQGISVSLGTWDAPPAGHDLAPAVLAGRQELVEAALGSLFPVVHSSPLAAGEALGGLSRMGVVTGVPTPRPPDRYDGGAIDRLIAAMGDAAWSALVLAQPVDEREVLRLRRSVLEEMRAAQAEEKAQLAPSPLAQHYVELLKVLLESLTLGYSVGAWRTAVHLSGDAHGYFRLGTLWPAVFAGERSRPEPVRVHAAADWDGEARERLAAWGLPDASAPRGPAGYGHPFAYQTLLTSQQLAAYVDLPHLETSGFAITEVPMLDAEPPAARKGERRLTLGRVVSRERETDATYPIALDSLARHVLVAGITGSGKTNTIFRLLTQAATAGVPFLVLEPAKAEYRALLSDPVVGERLRVFTAGDELVSPLRLNPFDVPAGTSVAQHLDLLRSVFGSSFGMWTPLPQVLERCLHEIYADCGWDLATDGNRRLEGGGRRADAFPTLTDLVAKVAEVVPRLGYEDRVTSDIAAALVTRLDGLRRGGKGRMLDTRRSLDMGRLLAGRTVVELEQMGDDDDKAFLMALLLVRLYEHRRAEDRAPGLRHLLVIEEAHRLLSAPARGREEQADPRGKAVETFSQLLSEVRAYGQGVVVADQVPVRLAPDVLKGTERKIAHRTVAAEDRAALAGTMAMDERTARMLTTLPALRAATFGDGDDAPILVGVEYGKPEPPRGGEVAERMAAWRAEHGLDDPMTAERFCPETCADGGVCELARALASQEVVERAFARAVLSTLETPDALAALWDDVLVAIRARRPAGIEEPPLLRALAGHLSDRYARRRGAQASWSFADTERVSGLLRAAILERLAGVPTGEAAARDRFREAALALARRDGDPFPFCRVVCGHAAPPLCLYRHAVADEIATGRHAVAWQQALAVALRAPGEPPRQAAEAALDAAYHAIAFPELDYPEPLQRPLSSGARRTALCYAQQMLAADAARPAASARRVMVRLVELAGLEAGVAT